MDPTDDLKAKSPPVVTGSTHVLPFSALSPGDFERLCLALAHLEGYERPEHVGASGPDGGRDIVAFRNGRRVVFQCKRYRTLKPKEAEAVVEKILALPERERPEELILLTSCSVGAEARERARSKAGSIDFQVWALTELDERVNRHSDLVARFFQLPAKTTPSKPTVPGNVLRERLAKPSLRWGAALGFAVLAAMAGSSPAITPQRGASFPANSLRRSKVPLPRPSLAVMTFKNKTGDAALDWLSTALAETVSAKLGLRGDIRTVDRLEVSLAETDLLLAPRAEISHQDRERIRSLLGTEFVLGGFYDRKGGASSIRLVLTLFDNKDRIVVKTSGEGNASNWLDLADHSTEDVSGSCLLNALKGAPLTPSQAASLRTLFPVDTSAAQLYFQGLERFRHFDKLGATDLFGKSADREPHPLVLAALADTRAFLGRSEEGWQAIQKAKRLDVQTRKKPRALPERYRREIEIIERKIVAGPKGAAEAKQSFFREYFADDLSYGLLAAQALIDAGSPVLAVPLLKELRSLPLAEDHPGVDLLEADALFVQHRYGAARIFARRAILKAQALGAVRQEALAQLQLASTLSLMGRGAEAQEQFRQARKGFERMADRRSVAQCIELTALFYVNFDLRLAQDLYRDAISRYKAIGHRREQARALFGLSAVLTEAGRSSEAEESSREAAALASSPDDGIEPFLAGARAHLAGHLTRARILYETAKQLFDLLNLRDDYASTLTNLGEIELMQGRLTKAKELHRLALGIHEKVPSEAAPYDMVFLGRAHAAAGEYPAARKWYDQAFHVLRSDGGSPKEPMTWAEAHLAMAELELLSDDADRSEERARNLIDGAPEELDTVRSRAFSLLARRLLAERKTDEAWKAANQAMRLASGDFRAVREAGIARAWVRAARNEVGLALQELDRIAAEAAESEQVVYEFESILTAGEIELADGQLSRGRRRLEALRARAEVLGFGQIVKRVDSALEQ